MISLLYSLKTVVEVYLLPLKDVTCSSTLELKKYNIICLQDVHVNQKLESFIKAERGYDIYFSSYTNMSRGVMVLMNNNFEQKMKRI